MTLVKFCGLRTVEDTAAAIATGCDLIGLNFVPSSKRYLSIESAIEIVRAHKNRTTFVGVFMNATRKEINAVLHAVNLDFLQLHGAESAEFCASFKLPYIKSLQVDSAFDFNSCCARYPDAFAFLLDSPSEQGGGSGETFDWSVVPRETSIKVILAGGLSPDNVEEAIATTQPWAVDAASGIEGDDGFKDNGLMVRFMNAVKHG